MRKQSKTYSREVGGNKTKGIFFPIGFCPPYAVLPYAYVNDYAHSSMHYFVFSFVFACLHIYDAGDLEIHAGSWLSL